MKHNNNEVLTYWNREDVESMYDKNLLRLEIELILKHLKPGSKILDAGCGEGEGTLAYSAIEGATIHAADFSPTRLKMAAKRLEGKTNVTFMHTNFLAEQAPDSDYDYIISQRFLINICEWQLQKKVLLELMKKLKPGGTLLMMEGCANGALELNNFRRLLGLEPIPVKWHNLFFDNEALISAMKENKYKLTAEEGLGEFFLLTRGIQPFFTHELNWNSRFNEISAGAKLRNMLNFSTKFSRLKLWAFTA
jgi:ubiquinone/menaquinone biosynthesis C-methylase UbiE